METTTREFIELRGERIEYVTLVTKNGFAGNGYQNYFEKYNTSSHGFLVVPKTSLYYNLAKKVQAKDGYGYKGRLAVYLEEDSQATEFMNKLPVEDAYKGII